MTASNSTTSKVTNFVATIPRFGHSTDISFLFSKEPSDKIDYALGTLLVGGGLFVFFLLWVITLVIFMCLGPQRVGFLAGSRMREVRYMREKPNGLDEDEFADDDGHYNREILRGGTMISDDDDVDSEEAIEDERKNSKRQGACATRNSVVRFLCVFSCLVVIGASVYSTRYRGFHDLKIYADFAETMMSDLHKNALKGEGTVRNMIIEVSDFQSLRDTIVDELRADVFCPDPNLDNISGQPVNAKREVLVQHLYALDDFFQEGLIDLKNSVFEKLRARTKFAETYINIFQVREWEIWVFMISFSYTAFFMMIGTIFAWAGISFPALACLNTWFLLPLLLLLVLGSWILVSVSSVGAVMNSDFCVNGADVATKNIIAKTQEGYLKDIFDSWVDGNCTVETQQSPVDFLSTLIGDLSNTMKSISNFTETMDLATNLEATCGRDFEAIRGYLNLITGDYDLLTYNATEVMGYISCDLMNTVYIELAHGVACKGIPYGGLWTISALFLVTFFSMMIITFRSAWHKTIVFSGGSSRALSTPPSHLDVDDDQELGRPRYNEVENDDDDDDDTPESRRKDDTFVDSPPLPNHNFKNIKRKESDGIMTASTNKRRGARKYSPKAMDYSKSNTYEIRDENDYETVGYASRTQRYNSPRVQNKRGVHAASTRPGTDEYRSQKESDYESRGRDVRKGSDSNEYRSRRSDDYESAGSGSDEYKSLKSGDYESRTSSAVNSRSSRDYKSRNSDEYESRTSSAVKSRGSKDYKSQKNNNRKTDLSDRRRGDIGSRKSDELNLNHQSVGYDINNSNSGRKYKPVAYTNSNGRGDGARYGNNNHVVRNEYSDEDDADDDNDDKYYKPYGSYTSYRERYADGKYSTSQEDDESTGLDDIIDNDGNVII